MISVTWCLSIHLLLLDFTWSTSADNNLRNPRSPPKLPSPCLSPHLQMLLHQQLVVIIGSWKQSPSQESRRVTTSSSRSMISPPKQNQSHGTAFEHILVGCVSEWNLLEHSLTCQHATTSAQWRKATLHFSITRAAKFRPLLASWKLYRSTRLIVRLPLYTFCLSPYSKLAA